MPFNPAPSLTSTNARTMLAEGYKAIRDGEHAFDFSGLLNVDSAAVAVLLAWQREARAGDITLSFINLPEILRNLVELYGVAELLPNQLDLSSFLAKSVLSAEATVQKTADPAPR